MSEVSNMLFLEDMIQKQRLYDILISLVTNRSGHLVVDGQVSLNEAKTLQDAGYVNIFSDLLGSVIKITLSGRKKLYDLHENFNDGYAQLPVNYTIKVDNNKYVLLHEEKIVDFGVSRFGLIHKAWNLYLANLKTKYTETQVNLTQANDLLEKLQNTIHQHIEQEIQIKETFDLCVRYCENNCIELENTKL